MRIAVVGSGYVGLTAAVCLAELGHEITCVDNDVEKISLLTRAEVPIHEEFLPELLARHRGQRVTFSTDLKAAVQQSEVVFIAVGTPQSESGHADLSYVESVARELAAAIDGYKLIVEKSTVPVFTHDWIRRVMVLNGASTDSFDVASNPEFLREGTAVRDFLYPDRIVVGVDSERAAALLRKMYAPLISGEYYRSQTCIPPDRAPELPQLIETSPKSAEIIKHASNSFLAMKISFINAVANICESVGADVTQVCRGIGTDERIGPRFLNPGIGYGGSCFPKDLMAFRVVARENGCDFRLLDEVIHINEEQRHRFVRKVRKALWTLRGKKVAALGLAFKGGTDDVRESPAVAILELLVKEGCDIRAYDPAAGARASEVLPTSGVTIADSPYDAAQGADALLILTDWPEFAALDLGRIRQALTYPIIVDGRNLYEPARMAADGFLYYSVGRPDVEPNTRKASTGN